MPNEMIPEIMQYQGITIVNHQLLQRSILSDRFIGFHGVLHTPESVHTTYRPLSYSFRYNLECTLRSKHESRS
jgi:hypothetical protein